MCQEACLALRDLRKYIMLNFDNLTKDLVAKHNPKIILLYGSLSRGDYTPKSDIDVVCYTNVEGVSPDTREFEGRYLDAWLRPISDLDDIENLIYLKDAKVLFDRDGDAQELLEKINDHFEEGPKELSENERLHWQSWTMKMLDRTYRGDIEANYRRTWLIYELLTIYFKFNQMWFEGSKLAFARLKEKDPKMFKQFEKVLKNPTDSILLKQLVYKVLKI